MISNEPVVSVTGVVVTVLTVLTVGVVNGVVVAVVAVEAIGVVPVVVTGVLTVDSDAVVNVVGVTVLSAKHTKTQFYSHRLLEENEFYRQFRTVITEDGIEISQCIFR